eukprot:TRINITY_DN1734_c0_g1_i1.p1 TRINITY_DN1734_c0_g1~~TRINITY_DN1734_c0_g1_i1.p1  ORF type:complete len:279 (+),score=-32.91 TRINITY_DN1734_c0_g1_i1:1403-2239(+)
MIVKSLFHVDSLVKLNLRNTNRQFSRRLWNWEPCGQGHSRFVKQKHWPPKNLLMQLPLLVYNIVENNISTEGAKAIGISLMNNSSLINLDLSSFIVKMLLGMNSITRLGVKAIATALQQNKVLTHLYLGTRVFLAIFTLGHNKFGDEGVKFVATALLRNTTLTDLDLCKLPSVSLSNRREQPYFAKCFQLSNNYKKQQNDKKPVSLQQQSTLSKIDRNLFEDPGAKAIADALQYNNTLLLLDLGINIIRLDLQVKTEQRTKEQRLCLQLCRLTIRSLT